MTKAAPSFRHLPWREGVGVVLLDPRGLVFAGERIDRPGVWQMPQGGIDSGEAPLSAALRELAEETGIRDVTVVRSAPRPFTYDLPDELAGRMWNGRYRGQRQVWVAMRFEGDDGAVDIHGTGHPEFRAWQWMRSADLLEGIVAFKREVYRQVFAAFDDLLAGQ